MNARILELEKVAATIKRTIVSLAREPFDVNGHEVRIGYLAARGSIAVYVNGKQASVTDRGWGYPSELMAVDICAACGVTDPGTRHDVEVRVTLAMG